MSSKSKFKIIIIDVIFADIYGCQVIGMDGKCEKAIKVLAHKQYTYIFIYVFTYTKLLFLDGTNYLFIHNKV